MFLPLWEGLIPTTHFDFEMVSQSGLLFQVRRVEKTGNE